MNLFIIAGIVGIVVILLGVLLAAVFVLLSRMVAQNQTELQRERSSVNPSLTLGFEIPVDADVNVQLSQARKIAAKRAAAMPRGANMRIGHLGAATLMPASKALEADPWTATKIAAFHTWQGAKTGPPAGGVPEEAATVARPTAAPSKKPEDLVPGVDYPFIEITDDMQADEVRRARIANAKARSQAVKALKQQGAAAPAADVPADAPVVAEAEKASPTADAITAAGIEPPQYVEITDDMTADEVRKARIQNAKARSAYHKALKEAGIDPREAAEKQMKPGAAPAATAASTKATTPAEPTPASGREATAVPADIPEPDYIEITDDMSADEVRKARVHNAKARSQYYRALKERGIDPKEVEAQQTSATPEPAAQAAPASEVEGERAAEASAVEEDGGSAEIPADVPRPDYIEISDDMSEDEVRRARVHNARERSAFFKALKERGIDPKQVADSV